MDRTGIPIPPSNLSGQCQDRDTPLPLPPPKIFIFMQFRGKNCKIVAVADPEFPRRGGGGDANPKGGGKDLLFGRFFPENCMKILKNWTQMGARVPGAPLDTPLSR